MRALVALAILGTSAVAAAEPAVGVSERDEVDVAPAKGVKVTRIEIDNRLGSVRVEGQDKPGITIIATKHALDQDGLDRLKVQLVPDPAGPVSITTELKAGAEEKKLAAGSIAIDLIVRAPRKARVEVRVWNGRVEVEGVDNGAELSANQGDIAVTRVIGEVRAESAQGRQDFEDIIGALFARGLEGDIAVDTLRGDALDAVLYRGTLRGSRIKVRDLAVRVVRGDVELEAFALAGSHLKIAALHGRVTLSLGGSAVAKVRAHSGSGEVTVPSRFKKLEASAAEVVGYLGSGHSPAVIDVSSRVGSVTLAEF